MSAPQFGQVRAQGVRVVARSFGLEVIERPAPGSLSCCPACNEERRGTGDRRGAAGLERSGAGWRCHRCNESGDAVTLAAWLVSGKSSPTAEVIDRCAELGLCEPRPEARARPRQPYRAPPPPAPPAPPKRPPLAEVLMLWAACVRVLEDELVTGWLQDERGLDAGDVELWDLARALPVDVKAPAWARYRGHPWPSAPQSFRVLSPLYDHQGSLVSLHARALTPTGGADKAAQAAGFEVRGLAMADPLARRMLRGDADALELVSRRRDPGQPGLIIAEGLPDFLTWGTNASDADELAPAVLGIFAGGWTDELAARIPDGARVLVATDRDTAGNRYADLIINSLAERMRAGRLTAARWAAEFQS